MKHVIVFRETGRYGGWPANNGIWQWQNEIVVGFNVGDFDPSARGMHPIRRDGLSTFSQARSLDGGETWGAVEGSLRPPEGTAADALFEPYDFSHLDFALRCIRSGDGDGAQSWFYVSHDRCRTWQGPHPLPSFGLRGVAARTDYLIYGPRECVVFLTATNPLELPPELLKQLNGRPFCARTTDGGATWEHLAWIGPQPTGRAACPSSVRLPDGRVLVALRRREEPDHFMDLYESNDACRTWRLVAERFVDTGGHNGNPPMLLRLADGRLCLTYGYRREPFGIRAKLSDDDGRTWSQHIVLRDDGGNPDLGYTRTVQRPDEKLVTIYYFNDDPERERHIAATIWQP